LTSARAQTFIDALSNNRARIDKRVSEIEEKIRLELKIVDGMENLSKASKGTPARALPARSQRTRPLAHREQPQQPVDDQEGAHGQPDAADDAEQGARHAQEDPRGVGWAPFRAPAAGS
jgi:hypothetical protein